MFCSFNFKLHSTPQHTSMGSTPGQEELLLHHYFSAVQTQKPSCTQSVSAPRLERRPSSRTRSGSRKGCWRCCTGALKCHGQEA
eukprot:904965-Pelagomonas_calceolata.AAC.5